MKIATTTTSLIRTTAFASLFIVSLCHAQPYEKGLPDPDRGFQLAQKLCTNCHLISPDVDGPVVAGVPSFQSLALALTRDKTPEELAQFMMRPHSPMPDMHLKRDEIRDLLAYIQSLRGK
jgi:cytochrome c2